MTYSVNDRVPLWRRLLLPLSWLYGGVMALRRHGYSRGWLTQARLGVPVLSVGNIRVGGTGKTPLVAAITAAAVAQGRQPVILARGYKSGLRADEAGVILGGRFRPLGSGSSSGSSSGPGTNRNDRQDGEVAADEARLHSARHPTVPVIIGADRQGAFRAFRAEYPDWPVGLVILEDGGQHLAIHRDVDIMVVDWQTTAERIRPLPSGNYREGLEALAGAAAVIVSRCPKGWPPPPGMALWTKGQRPVLLARFELGVPYRLGPQPADDKPLRGAMPPVHVLTGIAGPERLVAQLEQAGYAVVARSFYADHEPLPVEQLSPGASSPLRAEGQAGEACGGAGTTGNVGWLITEKDLYRQEGRFRASTHPVWVMPLQVAVIGSAKGGPQSLAELLVKTLPSP